MMQPDRIDDEMLMAYVDGELGAEEAEAVRKAIDADPTFARQAEAFRETRRLVKEAYFLGSDDPLPDRLVASAQPLERGRVVAFSPRRWRLIPLALAASFLFAVGLGGYVAGRVSHTPPSASTRLLESEALSASLDNAPSGEKRPWRTVRGAASGSIRILGTYPTADAICRAFTVDTGSEDWGYRGVACRREGMWRVELAVREGNVEEAYVAAADRATQSVDAFLDAAAAKPPLDATAEQRSRSRGWNEESGPAPDAQ